MKFLHLSDLHLGKRVNEFSMLEDQEHILEEILAAAAAERPQAVLIAGDIYDKPVPPAEAVRLFDSFICRLSEAGIAALVISGNHDSPERLSFGSRVMARGGIYIAQAFQGTVQCVALEDEYGPVNFYLLPFVKPAMAKPFFPEEVCGDTQSTVETILRGIHLDEGGRNVLTAHLFVTGCPRCDSEDVVVGGAEGVPAEIFNAFDYTALGHLHGPQTLPDGKARYCGTPLKYSFSESCQQKSLTVVELREKGSLTVRTLPLTPKRDLREIRGGYNEIASKNFYDGLDTGDYFHITLTDEEDVFDAVARLRSIYPRIMRLDYDNSRTRSQTDVFTAARAESRTPLELFDELYFKQNGAELTEEQKRIVSSHIEDIWEDAQ